MLKRILLTLTVLLVCAPLALAAADAAGPDDRTALTGLASAKAVFDVRSKESGRLLFNVKLIERTYASLLAQGVKPEFVVSFRGATLPMLRSHPLRVDEREEAILREVRERLAELEKGKARLEACNVAAQIFKVTPEQLAPGVSLIGNSLISLIGYQNRGYAIVPME